MSKDYSQPGDPYRIGAEYTAQAFAAFGPSKPKTNQSNSNDYRGNSILSPRSIPTQAEADAIMKKV